MPGPAHALNNRFCAFFPPSQAVSLHLISSVHTLQSFGELRIAMSAFSPQLGRIGAMVFGSGEIISVSSSPLMAVLS